MIFIYYAFEKEYARVAFLVLAIYANVIQGLKTALTKTVLNIIQKETSQPLHIWNLMTREIL